MDKNYLTIREVSNIANVSYQAIYQRSKTSLKKYVVEIEGHKYFNKDVLREFKIDNNAEENKKQIKSDNKDTFEDVLNDNSTPLHYDDNAEELKNIISELRAELKEKNEIIKSKDELITEQSKQLIDLTNRVTTLFENSQKLQLQTQFLLGENNSDRLDEQVSRASDEIIEEIKPKRRGILSRFFK